MLERRITRRAFSGGMLAAGAMAAAARPARSRVSASEKISVGVIGCRNRGWQNAKHFHESGRFEVATVCDCDSAMIDQAMKRLKGTLPRTPRLEKDFRRILDDKSVDAIIVATPDHWHGLMTVLGLEAGKHVYLEKPASHNINDGKAMVAAQKRHPNLIVGLGTQQRSGPHFIEAKAFIESGGLGKIGFARAWMVHKRHLVPVVPDSDPPASLDYDMWLGPAPYRPYNEPCVHYNWHFIKDHGTGDTGNWGAHWLDLILWYTNCGLPRSVSGAGGTYITHDAKEFPDTQTIVYEYPDMTVVWEKRLWSRYGIHGWPGGAEIDGEKGSIKIDRGRWYFYPIEGGKVSEHPESGMEMQHVENFADAIANGTKPAAGIVDGHHTAILCHLANICTEVNRRLEFDPAAQTIKDDAQASRLMGREYRKPWQMPPTT